jgi:O-glycosyl hydrolase
MSEIHKEFPYVPVRFTEGSVFGLKGAGSLVNILRNYASSYNAWVTMLDEHRKPNNGPFAASRTIIERNTKLNNVTFNFDYYMYGHFMKFIEPGSVRISSEGGGSLSHVAFSDPGGKTVLIVVNSNNQEIPLSVSCNGGAASVNIRKNSITTLRWDN